MHSNTSLRDHFIWEMHVEGVAGHFGRDKTIILVEDKFYLPSFKRVLLGLCCIVECVKLLRVGSTWDFIHLYPLLLHLGSI